jgi:hypothetical protein
VHLQIVLRHPSQGALGFAFGDGALNLELKGRRVEGLPKAIEAIPGGEGVKGDEEPDLV